MNRAERRRQKKQAEQANKIVNIKPGEIRERIKSEVSSHLEERTDALITETVGNSLAVTITVLHDKFGFGKTRAQRFMNEYNKLFDAILEDYVSFDDMKEVALELGVGLENNENG